jgi:HK97 family phage major capsid protein/HK97 family phage prohead protease
MNRAYSVLSVKELNDGERVIRGIATTPSTDRMGDIIEPLGVSFKNPLPLLWAHQTDKPVGLVTFDAPTKAGITFEATIAKVDDPGMLQARVDEAWQSVKAGLVRAVSVGFRPVEYNFMDDGGIHFMKSEVMELSLVVIPANMDATITNIRSFDTASLAASGHKGKVAEPKTPPGATGSIKRTVKAQEAPPKMANKTYAEQITAFEATRQAKSARMDEIMSASAESGETLDAAQSEEYDGLEAELKQIDEHLVRLRKQEKNNAATATPVDGVNNAATASNARTGVAATVKGPPLPKGTPFTRYVIAMARSRGDLMQAREIAKQWQDTPEVEQVINMFVRNGTTDIDFVTRAGIAAGNTSDTTWASPLINYNVMAQEFIEYLRPMTIIGRINNFRRVPFNVKMPRGTGGTTVNWVGEGAPKPVSAMAFDTVSMTWAKCAGIVILTDELVRFSNPSAEAIVQQDLAAAIATFLDVNFIDPTKSAVTSVSPASVTNGVSPISATGTTPDALRADLKTLLQSFAANNIGLTGSVFVMTAQQAVAISLMRNSLGQPEFPGVTIDGGTLNGIPIVASENVPGTGGSPTDGSLIVLLKPPEILLADDGQVSIDASREASVQMDGAPDSPPTASTVSMSLWQNNMVGIRAERYINWVKRRSTAVGFIQYAKYSDS